MKIQCGKGISEMLSGTYQSLKKYLEDGSFPANFPSTRSNFIREARKYKVNKKGVLLRNDGRIVVKKRERKSLFLEMHKHSGKIIVNKKNILRARCVLETGERSLLLVGR